MTRSPIFCLLLSVALFAICGEFATAVETINQRVSAAITLLDDAEDRFQSPDPQWFNSTRQALSEETKRVGLALDSHGEEYSAAWKKHLHWTLLTSNLGDPTEVDLAELAWVRRWLFSNREGLEYPFFAGLRNTIEAHLDAVYAFSQPNLKATFQQQVGVARQQILALAAEPTDTQAAALGRTLGWFERTRQLPKETATVRSLLSLPNAQIVIAKPLIDRAIGLLTPEIAQDLPVSDRVTIPGQGLLSKSRTAHVHGTAHTQGQLSLELAVNRAFAELKLVYLGEVKSHCRAVIGPVTVGMQTAGPVRAITSVQLSLRGVQLLATEVFPQVRTHVTGVSARSNFVRRIGRRRAQEPASFQQMNARASSKTASLIREGMDERVAKTLAEIQAELLKSRESLGKLPDVLAPIVREGAAPHWDGLQSTTGGIVVNAFSQRREQLGAVDRCPVTSSADVHFRLHVSFFNNMAETIMAGKTFTDKYFMNYGKILQAELPPALMVHSRSVRWAIVAAKPRPLEISIPAPNQFRIQLRMQRVEIGEEQFSGPTIATIDYTFGQDEFDEYRLERQGDVTLDSSLPTASQDFLLQKLRAFFAPVLDAGGVALPEGGSLGRLRGLKPRGATADRGWLTLGIDVPTEVLEQWMPLGDE